MIELHTNSAKDYKALTAACVTSVVASLTLAVMFFVYVPVGVDGGWYSYPAYAWSQGGDPSENIPGVARPSPLPNRAIAKFTWENRSNLIVLLTGAWFKAFSPSWVSLKVLGAVQLLLLTVLVGAAVLRLTGDLGLSLFGVCLVASDSRLIAEALSDARPDLFIAAFAVGLLWLLIRAFKPRGYGSLAAAAVLAGALPLLHVTSANAIAFFLAFLAFFTFNNRYRDDANRRLGATLLIAFLLTASFLFKQVILDVLLPTKVPENLELAFRHGLVQELEGIIHGGLIAKLTMEWTRWREYFFVANSAHLLFVIVGLVLAVKVIRRRPLQPQAALASSLVVGFVAAVSVMFLVDSHPMVQHALVVAVLGYVGFIAIVGAAKRASIVRAGQATAICISVLALAALLNFAHAYNLYGQYAKWKISNAAEEAALLSALPATGDLKVIGPAEIWPYLTKRKQPLVLIDNHRSVFLWNGRVFRLDADADYLGASYLVINKQYYSDYGWDGAIAEWSRNRLIVQRSALGDCDLAADCLRIYAFVGSAHQK